MIKILHLTLKKKWFDLIASGQKKVEYREIKKYWISRFFNKDGTARFFDEIHFKNGYGKNRPFMRVEWKGWSIEEHNKMNCYAIKLGKIIEKNFGGVVKNDEL